MEGQTYGQRINRLCYVVALKYLYLKSGRVMNTWTNELIARLTKQDLATRARDCNFFLSYTYKNKKNIIFIETRPTPRGRVRDINIFINLASSISIKAISPPVSI